MARMSGRDVDHMISDLLAQGLVVVPMKPTMEQIIAATAAAEVTVEQAWQVYTAMLATVRDIVLEA